MNQWLLAALALLPGFIACGVVLYREEVIDAVVVPTPAFELMPRSVFELEPNWLWLERLRRQLSKSWLNCCSRSRQ